MENFIDIIVLSLGCIANKSFLSTLKRITYLMAVKSQGNRRR